MLRPYQELCLTAVESEHRNGTYGQLIALPCGAGKTRLSASIPQRIFSGKGKHCFIVNANELLLQAYDTFTALNPHLSVGIERAGDEGDLSRHDIVIASIQSLSRPSRLKRFEPGAFASVQVDECHGSVTASYMEVFRHLRCLKSEQNCNRDILLTGVSATPARGDNQGLEAIYSKIPFSRSIVELMRDGVDIKGKHYGYLSNLVAHRIDTYFDISSVKTSHGDFDDNDLASIIDNRERNRLTVKAYRDFGENLPAFCFTASIAHSLHMCEEFNLAGIPAAPMTGDTPAQERKRLFAAMREGSLKILASCQVLSQGVDFPAVCVGLLCRPTRSALSYRQKAGRICRPFPSPEDYVAMVAAGIKPPWVKPGGILIDMVDLTSRHRLIEAPSLFGLRNDMEMDGRAALEVVDEVEKLERESGLDLRDRKNLREMKSAAEQVDLFSPPTVPPEVSRYSKLSWLKTGPDRFCLSLAGNKSVRIAANQLGQWEIYTFDTGIRHHRWTSDSLAGALHDAEKHFVPQREIILLRDSAGWTRESPTENQTLAVYRGDARVRAVHKSAKEFHTFALARHRAGEENYSKGGLSRMISSMASSKPAWLQRKIEERKKAVS